MYDEGYHALVYDPFVDGSKEGRDNRRHFELGPSCCSRDEIKGVPVVEKGVLE